jgi:hypothetical protein
MCDDTPPFLLPLYIRSEQEKRFWIVILRWKNQPEPFKQAFRLVSVYE